MIQNKSCVVLLAFLLIIGQSICLDLFSRKDKQNEDDIDESSVVSTGKYNRFNDDKPQPPTNRRDRYPPYTSSSNNYRSRSRWSSPSPSSSSPSSSYDDRSDYNDRSSYGYGTLQPGGYDHDTYPSNGPSCYSLLDPMYPLFSDICGSVPQARYSLPNAFGHLERWQIAQLLSVLLGPATPSSGNPVCARSLRLLLCPLLFPPCARRYEAPPVLPCQPFCRAIKSQCASPSLELLPCDLLPFTSDLCPINPAPYSSLLASFGPPSPFNSPLPPMGLPPSALSSLLAQSALSSGFSPMDLPPGAFASMLAQSAGFSPMDMPLGAFPQLPPPPPFPQMFPPGPFAPAMTPPGVPSLGFSSSFGAPGMPPPPPFPSFLQPSPITAPGLPPPGFASFLAGSGMPAPPPMNPFFNADPYMADSLTPILVDFPPLQYAQGFPQAPRFFPYTRSATEKV